MMPRSDKFYVYLVVGAAGLLVIVSIIAAIKSLSGEPKSNPVYQNAPPPALMQQVNSQIIDPTEVTKPPIDDATYTYLYKESQRFASAIMAKDWRNVARSYGVDDTSIYSQNQVMDSALNDIDNMKVKIGKVKDVQICRPTLIRESQDRLYLRCPEGDKIAVTTTLLDDTGQSVSDYSVDVFWQLDLDPGTYRPKGGWFIKSFQMYPPSDKPVAGLGAGNS